MLSRRQILCASLAAPLVARAALARGRTPIGGRVTMHVPWPLGRIDPHRVDDAAAAIFGDALFDALYAREEGGAITPALAEAEPEVNGSIARVTLRERLKTASGKRLDARDAGASLARARALGASDWLADVPAPRVENDRVLAFATSDGGKLARALASPLTSIVPLSFIAEAPDGTGPFRAERRGDALVLARNANAALGPAFLDEIIVRSADTLQASLRAFETGADDIGWLGSGLYGKRPGSRPFDVGAVAWAILCTGREAAQLDAPGVAQSLCDAIPPSALAGLVVGPPWTPRGAPAWSGAPCDLLVRDDAPWLVELAKIVAGLLSSSSHEVTARPIAARDLAQRRSARSYALAIDVARPAERSARGEFAGLVAANGSSAAFTPKSARSMTSSLRVGILGEIRVAGARIAALTLPAMPDGGIDWGNATRVRH